MVRRQEGDGSGPTSGQSCVVSAVRKEQGVNSPHGCSTSKAQHRALSKGRVQRSKEAVIHYL